VSEQQDQDYRGELLRVFKVDHDDIEANRVGLLGPGQRQRLVRSGYLQLLMAAGLAVALLGIVFAVAERPVKPAQVILTLVLFGALLILGVVTCLRYSAAAAAGEVDREAGVVHVQMRGRAGWYLNVNEQSFKLPVQYWHIQNGAPYWVYWTPKAKRIVAMEPDGWG
jgi:hypothetical protein